MMSNAPERRDCVVIIPMYNERENAAAVIDAVLALEHGFDVLVIDDNSPDGTADIVKAKMAEHPGRVLLTERTGKLGLGTAYIEGFRRALAEGYGYVFEMDADFSHNPADLYEHDGHFYHAESHLVGGEFHFYLECVAFEAYGVEVERFKHAAPVAHESGGGVVHGQACDDAHVFGGVVRATIPPTSSACAVPAPKKAPTWP